MQEVFRKHHISFKNAFSGIFWAVKHHPNFRVHLSLSFLALFASVYYRISFIEFLIIIFAIVLGLSAEMINTAIEAMTDLITKEWHEDARIAKDVSAGMMLITAFGTILVAVVIFLPRIGSSLFGR